MSAIGPTEELEVRSHEPGFRVLGWICTAFFALLVFQLWRLQILYGEEMSRHSNMNRLKRKALPAQRGFLLDRKNRVLAENRTVSRVTIHLSAAKDLKQALRRLSLVLNETPDRLQRKVEAESKKYGPFHPIVLKESLSGREIYALKLLQWDVAGVSVEESFARFYPLQENGSQVLGHIGEIGGRKKRDRRWRGFLPGGQIAGKSGLEKMYDAQLRGSDGLAFVEVDALNRLSLKETLAFDFLSRKPVKGMDVSLNLSRSLQEAAFKAFFRNDAIGDRTGAAIAMKTNGEILAYVSVPGFDPNFFSFKMGPRSWSDFLIQSHKTFINKGIQEYYAPGSTIKPFIALAALQEGLIQEDTLINSTPAFRLKGRTWHDSSPKGHGLVNVLKALEKSSNTFFYKTGGDLGSETVTKYLRMFGFGKKTGIDLPDEKAGWDFQNPASSRRLRRPGDVINLSIGQGEALTTPLQLLTAYNAIATEGLMVRPFLLKKTAGEREKALQGVSKVKDTLTDRIQRKWFKVIKKGLKKVVQGEQGTARYYNLPKTPFSGKTGTVQVAALSSAGRKNCRLLPRRLRHHGWFAAFAPSDAPEIAVVALTEHSCAGGSGSAPIARDIIRAYFKERQKDALAQSSQRR